MSRESRDDEAELESAREPASQEDKYLAATPKHPGSKLSGLSLREMPKIDDCYAL